MAEVQIEHPGRYLSDAFAQTGIPTPDLADRLGEDTKNIKDIIRGKRAISATLAVKLEMLFDGKPMADFWLALQRQYDLAYAQNKLKENKVYIEPVY